MAGHSDRDFDPPTWQDLRDAGVKVRPQTDPASRGDDPLARFIAVPNHAMFFFTSEDTVLDLYLRTHWAALDGLSGEACDIHVSLMQLFGEEDFYSQMADLRSIPGIDAVQPLDLPAVHFWSSLAHGTLSMRALTREPDLRDALRAKFSIVRSADGPITLEHVALLRRATIRSNPNQGISVQEDTVDPVTVITLISSGLKLVDQFRELAIRFRGQQPTPPGAKAEQSGSALEVRHNGTVTQTIDAAQLHMDQWDTVRFEALRKRIRTNWDIYNDLFTSEAGASAQDGARIRADMRNIQETLCRDFKEMVGTYERTLGASLPDHYQLYEVCG